MNHTKQNSGGVNDEKSFWSAQPDNREPGLQIN